MKRSGRTSSTSECDHLHTSAPADKRCKPNNNEPDTSSEDIIAEQLNVDFVRRNFTTTEIVGGVENHTTSSPVTEECVQQNPSKSPLASEETVDVKPYIKIEIKSEPGESLVATAASSVLSKQIVIKTEPDEHSAASAAPSVSPASEVIKAEPVLISIADATISTSTAIALPTTAAPTAGTNSPQRASCNYGIRCFRRNPQHRNDMAHPGDPDYRRPDFPPAPPGMPACPFGASCYRRNPQHFVQFNHPPISPTGVAAMAMRRRNAVNMADRLHDLPSSEEDFEDSEDDWQIFQGASSESASSDDDGYGEEENE